jgi:hypothetical protein
MANAQFAILTCDQRPKFVYATNAPLEITRTNASCAAEKESRMPSIVSNAHGSRKTVMAVRRSSIWVVQGQICSIRRRSVAKWLFLGFEHLLTGLLNRISEIIKIDYRNRLSHGVLKPPHSSKSLANPGGAAYHRGSQCLVRAAQKCWKFAQAPYACMRIALAAYLSLAVQGADLGPV